MIKYDKLVRNNIPKIIADQGKKATFRIACEDEYMSYLEKKLDEEVAEFHESKSLEELADIQAVIDAIILAKDSDFDEFNKIACKKRLERGGFTDGIILIEGEE